MTDGQPQLGITAAPLPINGRIIVGASLGDLGLRDWIVGLDAATGKVLSRQYTVPTPGEPGSDDRQPLHPDRARIAPEMLQSEKHRFYSHPTRTRVLDTE